MKRIIKIISVEDTRQWEEGPDDKWFPIPGSGIEHQCARCSRNHEIHATVLLEDNTEIIVGTGCMKADEAEIAGKIRSLLSAQRTLAKLERELAKWTAMKDQADRITAEAEQLKPPPCQLVVTNPVQIGFESQAGPSKYIHCGDVTNIRVTAFDEGDPRRMDERRECAMSFWRDNRARELGLDSKLKSARYMVATVVKRIERQKNRMGGLNYVGPNQGLWQG